MFIHLEYGIKVRNSKKLGLREGQGHILKSLIFSLDFNVRSVLTFSKGGARLALLSKFSKKNNKTIFLVLCMFYTCTHYGNNSTCTF